MDNRYQTKAAIVKEFTQAAAAKIALQADFKCETVTIDDVKEAIKIENNKAPPNIYDLIRAVMLKSGNPVNLTGEGGQYQKTIGVPTANGVDIITIRQSDIPNQFEVTIQEQTRQQTPTGPITLEKVKQPTFRLTIIPNIDPTKEPEITVSVGNRVVLNENDATPRPAQLKVVEQYADAILRGEPTQLAVMGTGTGKSWVQAGFTRAIGGGVYIVPDAALASETDLKAIKPNNKGDKNYTVVHALGLTPAQIKEHVERMDKGEHIHLILQADDPDFAAKAAMIQGQIIMMDESHQHTFTQQGVATLEALKKDNAMLALTGTPTGKLFTMFGKPMVDVNVASVMATGGMRRIQGTMTDEKPNENLVQQLMTRYLGHDSYLLPKDRGYMSIDAVKKANPGISDQAALDTAVEHNRLRQAEQKNFAFSTNKWYRKEIADSYNKMDQNLAMREALSVQIRNMRRETEIDARVQLLMEQDPKRNPLVVRKEVESSTPFKKVDLPHEMQSSQKKQIAMTVNAEVLSVLFANMKLENADFEMKQRMGELGKFLTGMTDPKDSTRAKTIEMALKMSEADIRAAMEAKYPGLRGDQRKEYIDLLVQTTLKVQAAIKEDPKNTSKWANGLVSPENVDLKKLKATNAETSQLSDPKASNEQKQDDLAKKAAALDALRTGLTMQVVSDQSCATGISIQSVLSTQQLVSSKADLDPVYVAQLHGRNIRDKDLTAVNDQVVSKNIKKEDLLTITDILATDSGKRLQDMYSHIEAAEAKQKATVDAKRATFTPAKEEEPAPSRPAAPGKS